MFVVFQCKGTYAGGGSGGSIYVHSASLHMTGYIYSNGGDGISNGGGGSGGRVNFLFNHGVYESGHVISKGMHRLMIDHVVSLVYI